MVYFSRDSWCKKNIEYCSKQKVPKRFRKKSRGLKSMFVIRDTLNGSNPDEDFHYNPSSGEIAKFRNAKITSCDVKLQQV